MAYEDRYPTSQASHNLIIESRNRAAVSGVVDVESFDEREIIMETTMGILFLQGSGLRIEKLSLDTGDVTIEGNIDKIEYEENIRQSGGFFGRLFK